MIYFYLERTAETYISVHNAKVRENREILKELTRKFGFERDSACPIANLTARHCKKCIQHSEFRASASCSKFMNVKSILNTVKIFRANFVFQDKRRVAQKS